MTEVTPEETNRIRSNLEAKRAQLRDDMTRLSAPPEDTSGISFGKRVGEGTSFAVDRLVQVKVHDQMQTLLTDVERALVKLDQDDYGTCDVCGGPIASERLEGFPWATLCVRCASER